MSQSMAVYGFTMRYFTQAKIIGNDLLLNNEIFKYESNGIILKDIIEIKKNLKKQYDYKTTKNLFKENDIVTINKPFNL